MTNWKEIHPEFTLELQQEWENARKLSDLDICYQEPISDSLVYQIEEESKESDLPFAVELVSWKRMKPSFQRTN